MITETDIAYAAGILDGEGSFVVFKDKRANHGLNVHISMNMVDRRTVEHVAVTLRDLSGDKVNVRLKTPVSGFSRRLQYCIDVSSKNGCLKTLEAIKPYLVTKRVQAELIINILQRAVQERKYTCTSLDFAMFDLVKRLKREGSDEARVEALKLLDQVTPSQAAPEPRRETGTRAEGQETSGVRSHNNPRHERPARRTVVTVTGEDIVQTPSESSGSGPNSPTTEGRN